VTGTTYRGTGVTAFQLNLFPGVQQIVVNGFLLVGTAAAPFLRVHQNVVFVATANGDVTVTIHDLRITCA
jgi:hypothetical protein